MPIFCIVTALQVGMITQDFLCDMTRR